MNVLFNIYNKQIISMQILGRFENLYKPEICMNYVKEKLVDNNDNKNFRIQYDVDTDIFVNFLVDKTYKRLNF